MMKGTVELVSRKQHDSYDRFRVLKGSRKNLRWILVLSLLEHRESKS